MREEENNHDKKDISNILEILPLLLWGKSTNEGRHFFFFNQYRWVGALQVFSILPLSVAYTHVEVKWYSIQSIFVFFFTHKLKNKLRNFALFGTELSLAQESILSTQPSSVICEALFTTMCFNYTGYYLLVKKSILRGFRESSLSNYKCRLENRSRLKHCIQAYLDSVKRLDFVDFNTHWG